MILSDTFVPYDEDLDAQIELDGDYEQLEDVPLECLKPLHEQDYEVNNDNCYEVPYRTCKKDTGKARLYETLDDNLYWIPIGCILRDDTNNGVVTVFKSFKLKPLLK